MTGGCATQPPAAGNSGAHTPGKLENGLRLEDIAYVTNLKERN